MHELRSSTPRWRAGAHRTRRPRRRGPLADRRHAPPDRRAARPRRPIRPAPTRRWRRAEGVGRESLDSIRQVMGLLRDPGTGHRRPGPRHRRSARPARRLSRRRTRHRRRRRRAAGARSNGRAGRLPRRAGVADQRPAARAGCGVPPSTLATAGGAVEVVVVNGPGVAGAPPTADRAGRPRRAGMVERVRALGGEVGGRPDPGGGWRVAATIRPAPAPVRGRRAPSEAGAIGEVGVVAADAAEGGAGRRPAAGAGGDRVHPVHRAGDRGRLGGRQRRARSRRSRRPPPRRGADGRPHAGDGRHRGDAAHRLPTAGRRCSCSPPSTTTRCCGARSRRARPGSCSRTRRPTT